MSLVAVDTSGRLDQLPLIIGAVAYLPGYGLLNELREKLRQKKAVLASRKRIKAVDLNETELDWVASNIKFRYHITIVKRGLFSEVKRNHSNKSRWKLKTLSILYYMALKDIVKENDTILLDRDYDPKSMDTICSFLKTLFIKMEQKNVYCGTGTSYEEAIVLADLIAGAARKNIKLKNVKTPRHLDLNAEKILFGLP